MKKFFLMNLCFIIILIQSVSFAYQNPRPLSTDQRIKVVAYQKNNIVQVFCTTFITTQVVFGKSEVVENVQGGDISAWSVTVPKFLKNMLFIKPTVLGSNTNITVITNKHSYYFHLISNDKPTEESSHQTYAIQFIYPHEEKEKMLAQLNYKKIQDDAMLNKSKNPQAYNWDYSFSGSKKIMPLHVFDDGRFTYMELRPNHIVPAIFAVDDARGNESVVNIRRRGNYLIVQRVAPQFTLRDGKHYVTSIFNNKLIRQSWRN